MSFRKPASSPQKHHLIASSPQMPCGEDAGRKTRVNTILSIFSTAPTNTTIPYILITTMLITSLACLQTVMTTQSEPASEPTLVPASFSTPEQEPESGAVFDFPTPESAMQTCAIVTASKALNLRTEPSEKASIITELLNGNMVVVIGRVGEWWKVSTDGYSGYAKADYLKESECE